MNLRKMVIVYTNAGDRWFSDATLVDPADHLSGGYPFGGHNIPTVRYFVENGRVAFDILATAPLPPGHEAQAIAYYQRLARSHLQLENCLESSPQLMQRYQALQSPDAHPEEWLDLLGRTFHMVSAYREYDVDEYKPMPPETLQRWSRD